MEELIMMEAVNVEIDINDVYLDWNNPRFLSKKANTLNELNDEDKDLAMIFYLVVYYDVESLVLSMIKNTKLTKLLLENERIMVQEYTEEKYIVREGNRRITALRIIFDFSILENVSERMNSISLASDDELFTYSQSKKNLKKIITENKINNDDKISRITPMILGSSKEENALVMSMLRKMHITGKKPWKSIDKQLFDYELLKKYIQADGLSIEESAKSVSKKEYGLINEEEIKQLSKELVKSYPIVQFYIYVRKRISNQKIQKEGYSIDDAQNKLIGSFLPICDVLPRMMKKYLELQLVSDEKGTYFRQGVGNYEVLQPTEFVDALIREILLHKKSIANYKFKTLFGLEKNFPDIYKKYISKKKVENETEEPVEFEEFPAIYPANSVYGDTVIRHTNEPEPLNPLSLVSTAYGSDGAKLSHDDIVCFVDEIEKKLIPVQIRPIEMKAQYALESKRDDILRTITINYISKKSAQDTPFKNAAAIRHIIDTSLVNANKTLSLSGIVKSFQLELNIFDSDSYPYISITLLRGLWESSLRTLEESGFQFNNTSDARGKVDLIEAYKTNNLESNSKCKKMAQFYGLTVDECLPRIVKTNSKTFGETYTNLNAPAHHDHRSYPQEDVDYYKVMTSKWLYLVNFINHELLTNK